MKNLTISLDEKLAHDIRVEAAKAGMSMSKFLAQAAREKLEGASSGPKRNLQKEALVKILAGPMWDVTEDGKMPTADERNARR